VASGFEGDQCLSLADYAMGPPEATREVTAAVRKCCLRFRRRNGDVEL